MENLQQNQARPIQIYNIVGSGRTYSNDVNNRGNTSTNQRSSGTRRTTNRTRNHRHQRREQRRGYLSEAQRERISSLSCLFGVIGTVVGAGLILVFLIAEYSTSLQDLISYRNLVIPGFLLLFLGIFGLIIGIYFCWVHKRRTHLTHYINRNDELEAGFHRSNNRNRGYINQAMVPDEPPSYNELTTGNGSSFPLPTTGSGSTKLPSYVDALKLYEITMTTKPESTPNSQEEATEALPPPYIEEPPTS